MPPFSTALTASITSPGSVLPYKQIDRPEVRMPKRSTKHAYDDVATMKGWRWIPEAYKS